VCNAHHREKKTALGALGGAENVDERERVERGDMVAGSKGMNGGGM
jgi:hypothetical protein